MAGHDELAARSVVVGSFGKTFHATGWKVGYALAPPAITAELRRVHQFTVFTVNAPMQHALARFLAEPARYEALPGFFARKRDLLRDALAGTGFELLPCAGSYFQLARYDAFSDEPAAAFAQRLVREVGVATIPLSAFYQDGTDTASSASASRSATRRSSRPRAGCGSCAPDEPPPNSRASTCAAWCSRCRRRSTSSASTTSTTASAWA